jgi:uncharacterized MnhB-related membrane protein
MFLQFTILSFVVVTATAVVLTRDPAKQAIGISFYGLVMALTKIRHHEEEQRTRHKNEKEAA